MQTLFLSEILSETILEYIEYIKLAQGTTIQFLERHTMNTISFEEVGRPLNYNQW